MRFQSIIYLLVVFSFLTQAALAQSPGQSDLSALIETALKQNPRISRAYNAWQAEQQKIRSEKSLDDPVVSYGHFGEEIQTRVGPQEYKVGVSQKLPFPGKLGLKKKAQQVRAQMKAQEYEAVKNEIIKRVKFTYYDLFWVDQAISINEEEKGILEKLETVAQRKYESNLIPQHDVIKLQIELSKIIQKLALLKKNRESLQAKMNSLLNRDPKIAVVSSGDLIAVEFQQSLDEVLQWSQDFRQELLAAQLSVEAAEKDRALAKMDYLPNFTVGYEYIDIGDGKTSAVDDGEDAWLAKVSVNIPLWFGKNNSLIREKRLRLTAAEDMEQNIANQVSYEVQDAYFQITAQKEVVDLYETALLPQARQAYEASQTGFETGSIGFLDWLDTERTYLQTRLAYYKSIVDYNKLIAQLERFVGGKLPY